MKKKQMDEFCDRVRTCSYALHRYLRHGHLEKVYENGLRNRLIKQGVRVGQQVSIPVHDEDGTLLGDMKADLLVENELIVELKAAEGVTDAHIAQLLGYLRASGKRYGLLINFGGPKLYIKRFVLDPS